MIEKIVGTGKYGAITLKDIEEQSFLEVIRVVDVNGIEIDNPSEELYVIKMITFPLGNGCEVVAHE